MQRVTGKPLDRFKRDQLRPMRTTALCLVGLLFSWLSVRGMTASGAEIEKLDQEVVMQRSRADSKLQQDNVFGLVEYQCIVSEPRFANPFQDATFAAVVCPPSGKTVALQGFCDDDAGAVYRVRFMPSESGKHSIKLTFAAGNKTVATASEFDVSARTQPGPIRVDPEYPYHFLHQGSNDHFFWNGTTAYFLLGVQDEMKISRAIERLARLKVNRIRVAINARTKDGNRWFEPQVTNTNEFVLRVDPWPAKNPASVEDPQFDTSRFNLPMWRKLDRLISSARAREVIVSVVFHLDGEDQGVDPFNGGKKKGEGYTDYSDEERYYRYAIARLAAFSNIMWDVTNEWHLFRNESWVNHFGSLISRCDPFEHLISVHGRSDFPFYQSPWVGFCMYQSWDEHGGYKFLRRARTLAKNSGRPMPQVNEEYGYEDSYPGPWGEGRKKPARSADNRRRLAWEMTMAGGYQTTGERADEPGMGGWINGLGNDQMTMLSSYEHLVDFFTSFSWWKCEPQDGAAGNKSLVLAEPNRRYVVYAPAGGHVAIKIPEGAWQLKQYNPRTGIWNNPVTVASTAEGLALDFADTDDWAALIEK